MKKLVSALLALSMVVSLSTVTAADVGTGQCYHLNANTSYGYFNDFTMNANDSVIEFDLSMANDVNGSPILAVNADNGVVIKSNSVTIAGKSAPITWDNLETKYWRHIMIKYLNGSATMEIDGEVVLSVASGAYCRTSGVIFVGWPGTILVDNLKVSNNAGAVLKFIDFDDEDIYLHSKSSDSTAIRTTVPAGSYTDFTAVDNYSMIFSSMDKVNMLTSAEYSISQNSAKLTYSGTDGGAANSFIDLSSANISANDYRYAVVTYMTPNAEGEKNSASAVSAALVGAIGSTTPSESVKNSFTLNTDGRYHSKVLDMKSLSGWTGSLKGLQLRFFESANSGDTMYVDSVILCSTLARANTVVSNRETVKADFGIFDTPVRTGLGYLDNGNYVCDFDSQDVMQYVSNGKNTSFSYDQANNAMKCVLTGTSDPSVYVDLTNEGISADTYKYIVYTYKIPTSTQVAAPIGNFYYICGNITVPTAGYESNVYPYTKDGKLHSQVVDLSGKSNWSGAIKGLRVDYFNDGVVGDVVYIDSITFCKTKEAASIAGNRKANGLTEGFMGKLEGSSYVCNFDSAAAVQHVTGSNNSTYSYDSVNNAMKCTATTGFDPNIYVDLTSEGLSADMFKYIVYTYTIPTSTQKPSPSGNFYYVCGSISGPTGGYESNVYSFAKDGKPHYTVIDLSGKSNWSGNVKGLRMDYFNDCSTGDSVYIDSIIFCSSLAAAQEAGEKKINFKPDATDASAVWNYFWQKGKVTGDEFIARSGDTGTDLNMYFRYNSASALTQTSLANRFKKAIKTATGVDIGVEVYTGFIDIKSDFKNVQNGKSASNDMQFTLIPQNGPAYCVWVPVTIILDSSCSSDLNGNDTLEPDPHYPDMTLPSPTGVTVTDSVASLTTSNGLAIHSNHETRVVHTANKTFAVYPTGSNGDWNAPNSAQFEIFEIKADGTSTSFYTGNMRNSSSKPNIMLGYDGKVYVFFATDANGTAQLDAYYFDPAASNYSVTKVSATKSYNGGLASGGYGYTQPVLDNAQKKVHMIFCGGQRGTGDFAWFTFNQQTKSWESNSQHISIGNRHCYVYAYANGNGGVDIVAERDVLLSDIGLGGIVTGADYAWDELSLFHIPDMYSSSYTKSTFAPADYTQTARKLYPVVLNNSWGDTYLASDGKLHILYQKSMHGTSHHDGRYKEMWHAVYDTKVAGTPALLYNKPIKFVNEENYYACRFAESTSGNLYILAMPANRDARVEIWTSADENDFTFSFDSAYNFSNTTTTKLSLIVSGPRNGSVQNNVIDCMYPTGDGTTTYHTFRVTLP